VGNFLNYGYRGMPLELLFFNSFEKVCAGLVKSRVSCKMINKNIGVNKNGCSIWNTGDKQV
jgi:hypothetical protein